MNLNKVFLLGRLTRDPEVKTTPNGQMVCTFGLATNRVWKNQDKEKQEQTEFHNIVLWQRLAEIASQYLQKGSLVLIEGRLQTRSWEDQSGTKKYKTEIVAENIQMGPKQAGASQQASNPQKEDKKEEIPVIDEDEEEINVNDIPF